MSVGSAAALTGNLSALRQQQGSALRVKRVWDLNYDKGALDITYDNYGAYSGYPANLKGERMRLVDSRAFLVHFSRAWRTIDI